MLKHLACTSLKMCDLCYLGHHVLALILFLVLHKAQSHWCAITIGYGGQMAFRIMRSTL